MNKAHEVLERARRTLANPKHRRRLIRSALGLGLAAVVLASGVAANYLWQRHKEADLRVAAQHWHSVNDVVNDAVARLLTQERTESPAAVEVVAASQSSTVPKTTAGGQASFDEWYANLGLTPAEAEARRQRLEAKRAAAGDMTLERAKRIALMRTRTGLDPAYINERLEEVEQAERVARGNFDIAQYRRNHPSLSTWLDSHYGPGGTP